ncbi:MAG TPA: AAA family ATPase [Terriglobales bacterium]|nr:AAA family ATPase [Terriglobales bacterium]
MAELAVVILATDDEQRSVLQVLVDGTNVARTVHNCPAFPVAATDPLLRRIQGVTPDVLMVDIPNDNPTAAIRAIETLRAEVANAAVFAVGSMSQPQVIVNAMRAGAREFIERPTTTTALLEAFVRLTAAQRKAHGDSGRRGKVFTVVNAKGGTGATTVAVNTALSLQSSHSSVALVDLAPLGHAALHLNVKPLFTIADALRNLHRMDGSLLESFMTRHPDGLHLLAGTSTPTSIEPTTSEFAALFDILVSHYRYIVVDTSTRLDAATRLVCNLSEYVLLVAHTDVASLWSAARVLQYLGESGGRDRVRLVLNRFRKIPGFSESDAEAATGVKLLWKIPNQYVAVSNSIDRGVPVIQQNHSEVARSFTGLAATLTEADESGKRTGWSLFKTV